MSKRWPWLLVAVLLSACSRGQAPARWLEHVREADRLADLALAAGDPAAARKALVASLQAEAPPGIQTDDERTIRQDICFRLALIDLDSAGPEEALAWAERGLGLGEREDLFTANLLVVQGRSLEGLGRDAEAAESYHRALKINQLLLEREMAAEGDAP